MLSFIRCPVLTFLLHVGFAFLFVFVATPTHGLSRYAEFKYRQPAEARDSQTDTLDRGISEGAWLFGRAMYQRLTGRPDRTLEGTLCKAVWFGRRGDNTELNDHCMRVPVVCIPKPLADSSRQREKPDITHFALCICTL